MSSWKIYEDTSLYFVTTTITDWYPIFTSPEYFKIIIESLKYCREKKGLKIYAFVIMPNHIHMIISVHKKDSQRISDIMRDFKRFTSREINCLLKSESKNKPLKVFAEKAFKDERSNDFKVWKQGFHPKAIVNERFCLQKLDYIHKNPVKKGYVSKAKHWKYSSAGFYEGSQNVPLQIDNIFAFS